MRREIENVVVGIRERYSESLLLADLADMAHLSPYHLARQFREETGMPPGAFLTNVRLEVARTRLLRTASSVTDICMDIGYDSLGAFTSRFTRTVGLPPGRYRRLAELGPDTVDLMSADNQPAFTYGTIRLLVTWVGGSSREPAYIAAFPLGNSGGGQARCVVLNGGTALLTVPAGRWSVRAVARGNPVPATAIVEPVPVGVGQTTTVRLALYPEPNLPESAYLIPHGDDVPEVPDLLGQRSAEAQPAGAEAGPGGGRALAHSARMDVWR